MSVHLKYFERLAQLKKLSLTKEQMEIFHTQMHTADITITITQTPLEINAKKPFHQNFADVSNFGIS